MRLTAGLDSGPVALRSEVPLGEDEDYGTLAPKLAELGGELLVEALDKLAAGTLEFTEQDEAEVTYAEKITAEERRLDVTRSAADLAAVVRGLTPHIGAFLELEGGERLGVKRARSEASPSAATTSAGEVAADGDALLIGTGDGVLRAEIVQPPGGKPMSAADYLRGHDLPKLA
jgi:methionyl-tRNA formyltransferase